MSFERSAQPSPPPLAPGTRLGPWLIVQHHAQGSFGTVHRAVRVGHEDAGFTALKLAVYPWDPRFSREAHVLSLLQHPSVPRLLDRGLWRPSSSGEFPFLVMEWIDGSPLYQWALSSSPSPLQLRSLLAHLARALHSVHSSNTLHRDIKGDNILVRHVGGRPVLLDFGSAHLLGAERLTWHSLPPCTPAYRSPAANLFLLSSVRSPSSCFTSSQADDLFSLGVTAFRLLLGEYPPEMIPFQDSQGLWHLRRPDLRPLLEAHPRLDPLLRQCLLRLLSMEPQDRGTAEELALALEASLGGPAPQDSAPALCATASLHSPPASPPPSAAPPLVSSPARGMCRPWLGFAAAAALACLLVGLWQNLRSLEHAQAPNSGTTALGDSSPSVPPGEALLSKALSQEPLPNTVLQQTRPNAKGLCLGQKQVPLLGRCWVEFPAKDEAECAEYGYFFLKGKCFAPVLAPNDKPQPTSIPSHSR